MLELNMQAFRCPPYGQRIGRPEVQNARCGCSSGSRCMGIERWHNHGSQFCVVFSVIYEIEASVCPCTQECIQGVALKAKVVALVEEVPNCANKLVSPFSFLQGNNCLDISIS